MRTVAKGVIYGVIVLVILLSILIFSGCSETVKVKSSDELLQPQAVNSELV